MTAGPTYSAGSETAVRSLKVAKSKNSVNSGIGTPGESLVIVKSYCQVFPDRFETSYVIDVADAAIEKLNPRTTMMARPNDRRRASLQAADCIPDSPGRILFVAGR